MAKTAKTVTCPECDGLGYYEVFNAYDPNYRETVVCERCHGKCFVPATSVKKTVWN